MENKNDCRAHKMSTVSTPSNELKLTTEESQKKETGKPTISSLRSGCSWLLYTELVFRAASKSFSGGTLPGWLPCRFPLLSL